MTHFAVLAQRDCQHSPVAINVIPPKVVLLAQSKPSVQCQIELQKMLKILLDNNLPKGQFLLGREETDPRIVLLPLDEPDAQD